MLNTTQVQKILDEITVYPGWRFVAYPAAVYADRDNKLSHATAGVSLTSRVLFRLEYETEDASAPGTGKPWSFRGREWMLGPQADAGDVIRTVWLAVLNATEHEAREWFRYRGEQVMNPHAFDDNDPGPDTLGAAMLEEIEHRYERRPGELATVRCSARVQHEAHRHDSPTRTYWCPGIMDSSELAYRQKGGDHP